MSARGSRAGGAALETLERALVRVEQAVVVVALASMLVAGIVQVTVRALGGRSFGSDEVAIYAMAFLVFVGSALAIRTHDHITVELLSLVRQERARLAVELLGAVALLVFGLVFTFYAWQYLAFLATSGERSLQLGIPLTVPVSSMVAGGVLLCVHILGRLAALTARLRGGGTGQDPDAGAGSGAPDTRQER